jgi:hypothetical protein
MKKLLIITLIILASCAKDNTDLPAAIYRVDVTSSNCFASWAINEPIVDEIEVFDFWTYTFETKTGDTLILSIGSGQMVLIEVFENGIKIIDRYNPEWTRPEIIIICK